MGAVNPTELDHVPSNGANDTGVESRSVVPLTRDSADIDRDDLRHGRGRENGKEV